MLGRRNIQREYMIHKMYEKAKKAKKSKGESYSLKDIVKQVAKEAGVTQKAVKDAHKFGRAIDVLYKSGLDKNNKIGSYKVKLYNRNSVIILASLEEEKIRKAIKYINNGEADSVEDALLFLLPKWKRVEIVIAFPDLPKWKIDQILTPVGDGKYIEKLIEEHTAGRPHFTKIPKPPKEPKSEPISERKKIEVIAFDPKEYDFIIETFNMISKKNYGKSIYEISCFYREHHGTKKDTTYASEL